MDVAAPARSSVTLRHSGQTRTRIGRGVDVVSSVPDSEVRTCVDTSEDAHVTWRS